jgi:hypothetical protein
MPIKDEFLYDDRWGSVGLDCSKCKYEKKVKKWPIDSGVYYCNFHHKSLDVEINLKGYKEGEWFCKNFENNGNIKKEVMDKFDGIKNNLEEKILYGFYGEDGFLKEVNLE